jgi:hypothetical protein
MMCGEMGLIITLFADDCIIYKKIIDNKGMKKSKIDENSLGEWAFENEIKINPTKSKAICFT